ncbi:MAG: cytochrome D1 domain-containing protein [Planctomycetota bacterium]
MRTLLLGVTLGAVSTAALSAQPAAAQPAADAGVRHQVYVACESSDEVYRVGFDGREAVVERVIQVGYQPTEVEGPHGLTVSLDGAHWFVSIAHGKPFGLLYKYRVDDDELVAECELGMFPATMQISPVTGLLYCVNFNLHGRMLPSTVSIVDPEAMVEVGRTPTGPMPHGSRLSADGQHHYSCAMMSGHLFEIDASTFEVVRDLQLDVEPPEGHESEAKPTWVQPHPTRREAYCALNAKATVAVVDLDRWVVTRRLSTGKGPYNLEVSPDGRRMVVTYKGDGAIGIWDLETYEELARLPSTRGVTHGVVISPDSRYAFVTAEGKGAEPGALDIVDLERLEKVAAVDVGLQAGGIAYRRAEAP